VTSSWFLLSTLNYDARSTAHQIYVNCLENIIVVDDSRSLNNGYQEM